VIPDDWRECALRHTLRFAGLRHAATLALAAAISLSLTAHSASAQGLFDFLFGAAPRPQAAPPQGNFFTDPFGQSQQQPAPAVPRAATPSSRGTAFCVRSCDGKYFPLSARDGASPAQLCRAFCPAAPTRVYFGSSINSAVANSGERYADSGNAYAYRKALRSDCTCNGRDPAGLAAIDLSQDLSLRTGDVVATTDGLVAYTGVRLGAAQTPDFSPVASFSGLTPSIRARLGEMKVAPDRSGLAERQTSAPAMEPIPAASSGKLSQANAARAKRAAVD
jgi:hypothetical protein